MLQRRKILISFLAITVLQGITYPAIALGSESNAMQVSSNSQTAEPNQNSNSIQGGDSNTITSDADDASQFSDSASESTQPNSVIHSSRQNRNDDRPDSSEPDKNNDSTSPNEPTKPDKPENGWDQNKEHYYENGTMAVSKDVFISSSPNNRKDGIWVRFDENGNLVKGEDHRNGGWYYFDEETGAMAKGVKHISSNNGKRVYYDVVTGKMAHGEAHLNYDKEHTGWYYFDQNTGKMAHDFVYLRQHDKWVYYDKITGKMQYGEHYINDGWYYMKPVTGALAKGRTWLDAGKKWVYYDKTSSRMIHGGAILDGHHYFFDPHTGAQYNKQQIIDRLTSQARALLNQHPDCPGVLAANGGLICPFGPCMAFVWYIFHSAGLDIFLCDGAKTGWPHHNYDWYRSRGRVSHTPHVGDIAFWKFGDAWAHDYDASHAGVVVEVNGRNVIIIDAAYGDIGIRSAYNGANYAHPYYDE